MLTYAKSRFHPIRLRLERHQPRTRLHAFLWELFLFTFKQGWACLFGAIILALVLLTHRFYPAHAPIARYDFLFLCALLVQTLLLLLRMETVREAKVILVFHVVGTLMELFKTSVGSWTYPKPSFFHIGHVPLFSGFMYASVGSYLARTTRIMDLRYTRFPSRRLSIPLALLIYANFFANHFISDLRLLLFAFIALAFGRTVVYFRPSRKFRRMPLLLAFALVTLFIWAAENISTFATIWTYPNQAHGWHLVHASKYGSWLLLMIISFILITLVHHPEPPPDLDQ